MFKSATLRLTGWYLVIVMALSLFFSFVIYQNSTHELDNSLRHQLGVFQQVPRVTVNGQVFDFEMLRERQLDEGQQHLRAYLINLNLLILLVAGFGSYFLARRTLRPIEEALEAQSRFTADASHELRTPLTAMKAEIEVALRDTKLNTSDAKLLFESNLEEIEKLELLSNSLLMLAQGSDGQKAHKLVLINKVFIEAETRTKKLVKISKTQLLIKTPQASVRGDFDSLVELLVILIDNAIKYGADDKRVELSGRASTKWLTIELSDNGRGIAPKDLPHIFSRFYRADESRNKKQVGGFGLGLAIAKQIVEMHHGTIMVESVPGSGTKFVIRLPLAVSPNPTN